MGGGQSCCSGSLHLPAAAHPDRRPGQASGPRGKEAGQDGCWDQLPYLDPPCRSGGWGLFIPGVTERASGKCHQTGDPSPSLDQGYAIPVPSITWVSNTRTPCPHEHALRHEALPKTGWQKPSLPGDSSPGCADVEGKDRNWWSLVTPKACSRAYGPALQHPECQQLSKESPEGVWGRCRLRRGLLYVTKAQKRWAGGQTRQNTRPCVDRGPWRGAWDHSSTSWFPATRPSLLSSPRSWSGMWRHRPFS